MTNETSDRRESNERIKKAAPRKAWPLTFAERQMAAEQGLHPESVEYNINSQGLRIKGDFDPKRYQKALDALVRRHPVLRSYYPVEHGEYVHRVADEISVPVEYISCTPEEASSRAADLNRPFSLAEAPLFRAHVFEHGGDDRTLHFTFHHIIMDGASWNTFITDLMALYAGKDLPDPELNFFDHAVWQNTTSDPAEGEAFFRQMFADGLPETEMPTHPIRPDVLPAADQHLETRIPSGPLKEAAGRYGVTRYELMLAALGITLGKYTGTEDVVVGTAMSGRTRPEQAHMIGMFVNTLPVRIKPQGDLSAKEYVQTVSRTVRDVKANQTYPFESLVPVLAPDRNASRGPVFDVLFNYLQKEKVPQTSQLESAPAVFGRQELAVDLMLEALVQDDDVRLLLSFSDHLYDRRIAENFFEQFLTVLSRLEQGDGTELVMDVAEIPEGQRRVILEDFAGPRTENSADKTIVQLFREQAALTPDRTAVVYEDSTLTYKELDEITDRLAAHLASQGLGRGAVAGVMVDRGLMMPIGALGVLKTGAAYLPMDPEYPAERLEYMLNDAGVRMIVADRDLQESVPNYDGAWVFSDEIGGLPAPETLPSGPLPEDLFILLYTSGTTGNPKGVMLLNSNIASFADYYRRAYHFAPDDRTAAYASFGFDAAMMDMYPTLTSGAALYIIPERMRLDLPGMRQYFEDNGITIGFMTTQLGRQFAEQDAQKPFRALSTGGESLTPIAPPNFHFYNVYGPTETTVFVTRYEVDKLYDRVPIGRAVDNVSLYVVDPRGRLAPIGVPGELGIAGRQVAAGYLNRPDLTEEKFTQNPFSEDPEYSRMYKTGDVVRFLPSGDIDFVGRRDFQVKIRGFRVELTEIEGRIREFEGIRDAAVVAQDDAGGGKRIVAYVVADAPVDVAALNSFIEETLPPYMVPAATMQLDRIPLNQNGKVDRRKLPKVTIQAEEMIPPRTDMEKTLYDVVCGILGTKDFGITTDLMYAGLNSLSSIKAAALITEATGRVLSTMDLMQDKTIEKIAARLEGAQSYEQETHEKRSEYPLTPNQLGLYFAVLKEPASVVYNIPFAAVLPANIDADRLENSLRQVIEAHPYVKTHLALIENQPVQVRNDNAEVEIVRAEGTEEDAAQRRTSFVRPFNLFDGPLYRLEIFRTPEHTYLLGDFHHIVFDGGSLEIFLRDLEAAYGGSKSAPETYTSFDLALDEQNRADEKSIQEARKYYADKIADGEGATRIPPDKTGSGGRPETLRAAVPRSAVDDVIRHMGITPANLFLAATALVTQRFASSPEVRIATITNGRDGAQLQNNLGMLVKTLPAIVEPDPCLTAEQYLEQVRQNSIDTMKRDVYSYLQLSSDFGYDAQILYAYQGGVVTAHKLGEHPFMVDVLTIDRAKFPISVNVQQTGDQYVVEAEYDTAVFSEQTIQAFADCTAWAAEMLVRSPETQIGTLSVETPAQKERTDSFSRTPEPVVGSCLNAYFERWARETPDAEALKAADGTLTFAELNARANRLAHALIERGVEKGDRVAFMLPRTSRILTSMLGIMKAGAAYIPVDPEYPEERIAHILEDSGAKYLLVQDGAKTPGGGSEVLAVDTLLAESTDESNPGVPIQQTDLCYMIYTSGSTGKPKGVMIEHRNIMNYVSNQPANTPDWALTSHDCSMVSVTTVSFDMFLKEAFTTLMNGLCLVLADDEESKNPDRLAALFGTSGGNAFNATPSRMLQYMELPEIREALGRCRVVMAGGEGYPSRLYTKLREVTDAELINTYGPTEITVSCNAKVLTDDDISVGPPLYGVVEQVMDLYGNPLPAGVTGELWIGGNGVGRGYWRNQELTDQQFVEWNGVRWYKSGDLARWSSEGDVRILGRNDGQIKLRGLRIELGEIEKALTAIPGVTSCVVLVRSIRGQEHLSAYYTADRDIPAEEVRETLSDSLTRYMVPTAYLQLKKLPTTPNGKTDRKALPEPMLLRRQEYAPPTNEREKAYTEIFQDILGLDQVGVDDSFFDLGGTSLLVTQLTIDAGKRGLEISYGDVFANPTPRGLASAGDDMAAQTPSEDITNFDYTAVHRLLQENTIENLLTGQMRDLGNVCISGATGFLGIHVLREYLRQEKGTAYCIVRKGRGVDAAERLKSLLVYYFSDSFDDLFGTRIVVVEGDVTDEAVFEKLKKYPVNTFINCAANVKHFSAGTDIEDVNVGGVQNAIAFCEDKGCRFIQISTASTAGMRADGVPDETVVMNEQMLYFGQDLSNKYANSKFVAERLTLDAASRGLDAKIMRVGNLMAREEDGEFQANFQTNNFLSRLKAYSIVGKIPYEALSMDTEFAPIDYTARAILALSRTPSENRVFHPYNDHSVYFGDILASLAKMGVDVTPAEADEYREAYSEAMLDPRKARHLNSLIAYQERGRDIKPVRTSNSFTQQVLLRLGFLWPITTPEYLGSFFEMMDGLGYFDEEEE